MAAGEMAVDRGRVRVITAKSGHYVPSVRAMRSFVSRLPMINQDTLILPDMMTALSGNPRFHTVGDFRRKYTDATPLSRLEVLRHTPPWARSGQFMSMINLLPAPPPRVVSFDYMAQLNYKRFTAEQQPKQKPAKTPPYGVAIHASI